ncbi:ATP-binding protein [Leptothermofonsia sp. ETS-13]|uniref:ATP-binding response regulator n=1 Tax=Leptothermofonsia sp. ETS-13 TaxID=3035696 RepID=UPI003BA0DDAB
MVPTSACLREFVEPTPTCPETADLMAVFAVLSRVEQRPAAKIFYEYLVLVDEQQRPKGLVGLRRLLPCLLEKGLIGQKTSSRKATKATKLSKPTPSCSLSPSLVEPLTVLPGDWLVGQFLLDPGIQEHTPIAIAGDRGEFLGLLDCDRLLKFLIASFSDRSVGSEQKVSSSPPVNSSETRHPKALKQQQRQINRLAQQILVQKEDLEQQVKSQQKTIHQLLQQQKEFWSTEISASSLFPPVGSSSSLPSPPLLYPLLDLLEQLPLPLMLQSQDGQILTKNAVWRQQIECWTSPNQIEQEVCLLLDSAAGTKSASSQGADLTTQLLTSPSLLSTGAFSSEAHHPSTKQSEYPASEALGQEVDSSSAGTKLCHIGPKPGTCICICPLKNGQEQVLQFIKIPVEPFLFPSAGEKSTPPVSLTTCLQFQNASQETSSPQPSDSATSIHAAVQPSTTLIAGNNSPSPVQSNSGLSRSIVPQSGLLWLILAQDITEQQHLARELAAKNVDLIHLNRLKDEFLACISHELRTPLTAVLGLSSLLKDQTLGKLNQRQVHYAQLIYQSSRHLMGVVNDILDLTRMETGQLELIPEPVDIAVVCSRAFEQAKQLRLLDDKHPSPKTCQQPQFSLEIEPGLYSLIADEQRLRQMLCHLLTNALKFTEPDQQIGLKVNQWGGWIAFTVWDRGIGIPADKQHLIFQKFQQLENPLTRRFEGAGLGLVLTQRLARLHGGDVTFISKEGEGSQFTILLPPSPPGKAAIASSDTEIPYSQGQYPSGRVPLSIPTAQRDDPTASVNPNSLESKLRHRLILLVEVVPSFIETLTNQLTGLGYRVVIARSGTEALEKARRLQPGIIFLNPVLPLLSGWDVLTLLKSSPETRQIPVVVTATQVDETHTHRSYADGWLSLPIQAKALRQTLKQLVTESEEPAASTRPSNALTILRLRSTAQLEDPPSIAAADLTPLLHSCHYQVLEADDLEQAELLARVWKPNVVLLDAPLADPTAFFQEFSHHPFLASLPLVTLDQETTQAANQELGLMAFPCLANPATTQLVDRTPETSPLLQVIQIAAGYTWRSSILVMDLATLPASLDTNLSQPLPTASPGNSLKEAEWLQALIQYLQTAGLRGLMGRSWQEVLQQIQSQSIDLLLICWTTQKLEPTTLERLTVLKQLENIPPILVLDHRPREESNQSHPIENLLEILQPLTSQILPPSLPMEELLKQIRQMLQRQ